MTDLSKLSDAELMELAGESAPPAPDFSKLSNEELAQIAYGVDKPASGDGGFLDTIGSGVAAVGKAVDSYTGAPARAALSELTRTEPEFAKPAPSFFGNLVGAGKAFASQFGEDPSLAPTGRDIAVKRLGFDGSNVKGGVSDFAAAKGGIAPEAVNPEAIQKGSTVMPADVAGLAIDIGADPLNLVPVGAVAKGLTGIAGKAATKIAQGTKVAGEALAGTKVGKIAAAPARVISNVLEDVIRPVTVKDLPELTAIAEKNGITPDMFPEQVEFGDNSFIGRKGRQLAGGPGGEPRIERHKAFMSEVNKAFDRNLEAAAKAPPADIVTAGSDIKDGVEGAMKDLFEKVEGTTYNQIVTKYPGLKINKEAGEELASKLNGIEKYAKGLVLRDYTPIQKAQGQYLLNMVSAARRTNGSLKQGVEELQAIGDAAFKTNYPMGTIPPDVEKSQELYFSLRDAIYKTLERDVQDGEALTGALKISNDMMSEAFRKQDSIGKILNNTNLAPEQVFRQITANTKRINDYKDLVGADSPAFAKLKGAYVESLIKREADGNFSFRTLENAMRNKAHILKALFEPGERAELNDIIRLGNAAGEAILNKSGTESAYKYGKWLDTLLGLGFDEGSLEVAKEMARGRGKGLALPKEAAQGKTPGLAMPQFGPKGIGAKEAIGLRLPQQISIQQRNEENRKAK